jgi:hypothetical protein
MNDCDTGVVSTMGRVKAHNLGKGDCYMANMIRKQ